MHYCYFSLQSVKCILYCSVYRSINGVRGFSRETQIAVAANIESREWRRKYNHECNIPVEHPRASSTDDVECFFSVLRDTVGKDFTLKQVCKRLLY